MLVLASLAAFSFSFPLVGSGNEAKPSPVVSAPVPFMHWGDYDGDGHADVFALYANGEGRLFHNASDGTFVDVTASAGLPMLDGARSALWVDYDSDGKLDLHLIASRATQRLYHNLGNGNFEDATASAGLSSILDELDAAWFDYDGDDKLDVMVRTTQGDLLLRNMNGRWFESAVLDPLVDPRATPAVVDGSVVADPLQPDAPTRVNPRDRDNLPRTRPPLGGSTRIAPTTNGTINPTTSGTGPLALGNRCPDAVRDQATGTTCIQASTTPALGRLYPLSNSLNISANGNVLIKTGEVGPYTPLQVNGEILAMGPSGPGYRAFSMNVYQGVARISATSGNGETRGPLSFETSDAPRVYVETNGRVGMGTTMPQEQLDVVSTNAHNLRLSDGSGLGAGATLAGGTAFRLFSTGPASPQGNNKLILDNDTLGQTLLTMNAGGDIGVGTYNPSVRLHVAGRLRLEAGEPALELNDGTAVKGYVLYDSNPQGIQIYNSAVGEGQLFLANGGFIGVGTTSPQEALDVNGSTRQKCVKITGGCDIVEGFDTGGDVLEPGTVLVIDSTRPGELTASTSAYDKKVAGVVSGAGGINAGISLGQEGVLDGATKVAMAGRVWVKCSAENGAIVPGDLLTTSDAPGHAMKATDSERSNGAVIGKAMTDLDEGFGLVLVLVNLQ